MEHDRDLERKFERKCRLCLRKEGTSPIFGRFKNNEHSILADRITSLMLIQVNPNDGLPTSICYSCQKRVDQFCVFRAVAQLSDRILRSNLQKFQENRIHAKLENQLEECKEVSENQMNNIIQIKEDPDCQDYESFDDNPQDSDNYETIEVYRTPERCENSIEIQQIGDILEDNLEQKDEPVFEAENDVIECETENVTIHEEICCQLCLKTFQSSDELKIHVNEHFSMSNFEISQNNDNENTRLDKIILKSEEESDIEEIEEIPMDLEDLETDETLLNKLEDNQLTCSKCGIIFTTEEEYLLHNKKHSREHMHKCKFCNKIFTRPYNCRDHEKQHDPEHTYSCDECGKNFSKRSTLRTHKTTHIPEQPKCTICNKNFRNVPSYKNHMKRHIVDDKFVCEICGKNYYNKSELSRHALIHSGKRDHPCHLCQMSFFSKPELTRHMKYHTGERKFKCSICFKSYFESTHLKIHERIHTGEKPYVCFKCGKAFISKSKLMRHEKIHSKGEMREHNVIECN